MKKEVIIGMFGLITLVGFIWSYKFLQGSNIFKNDQVFHVNYKNVSDLDVSAEVRINGYKVGSVTNIELNPQDLNNIHVTFTVNEEIHIPQNAVAAIKSGGVMGGRSIELKFSEHCTSNCAQSGDVLSSGSVGLMESMLSEEELDIYIEKITGGAKDFIEDMRSDTSSSTIKRTFVNLENTSYKLAIMTDKLNRVLAHTSKNIEATVANSASITNNLADNNAKITQILSNLEKTIEIINSKIGNTFDNANSSIVAIKTSLESADKSFAELNNLTSNISSLINSINNGDGTLQKLIHDKKMADDLEFAINNLGILLQDFRLNPKRYVNVSLFGKKQKEYNTPDLDPTFQE